MIKKEFDSEPVFNEKCLKAERNSYNGKVNTNFHNNKIPKEGSKFICLSVILIDSVFRTSKNYYPQVFLEECKYVVWEKKNPKYIIDDMHDYDEQNSDVEILKKIQTKKNSDDKNSGEENPDEENSSKEN